jgi:SAM-dependent methyltransferase
LSKRESKGYWDSVSFAFAATGSQRLWRSYSDRVNSDLFGDWLGTESAGSILKTDLFDEAVSGGLFPVLRKHANAVVGIDISGESVSAAKLSYPDLHISQADIRRLPFRDNSLDTIISNSTLDHFESATDIELALHELFRVLRPGGSLLISFDNLQNPVIRLRNALPFSLLERIGIVPYFVGATLTRRGLIRLLEQIGFKVHETRAIMHCPRVLAVPAAKWIQNRASERTQQKFLRLLTQFERLAKWPTRYFSGHFVAALAEKH